MKASILTIGTELLIGQVIDTNSAWLGEQLNALGIEIIEKRSVADKDQMIKDTLDQLFEKCNIVLITGGLGPTNDDITKKTLAAYWNRDMYFDEKTYEKISQYFKQRNIPMQEAHKEQCYMPMGVTLLANNMGTAPGMWLEDADKIIVSMPGVPSEMKYIFENDLRKKFEDSKIAAQIFHRTIHTAGTGETVLATLIQDIEENLPKGIAIAYLPSVAQVRVRISGIAQEGSNLREEVLKISTQIEERIQKYIIGFDGATLASSIREILKERRENLTVAESCTGGYLSHLLVQTPGISQVYDGSITAYSYALKQSLLGVDGETLKENGAVSEEVVEQMVLGCIEATKSTYAISISGIAGPGGGTPDKPVGTVWVACGNKDKIRTKKLKLTKNRDMNIKYSAILALILFRRLLVEEN